MLGFLITKDKTFFEMFNKSAVNVAAGARALSDLMQSYPEALETKSAALKNIEHQGDTLTHQTIEMLNKTFITPIDREDIHELITKLDNVLDLMDGASGRLALYQIAAITPEARAFAELLNQATGIIAQAINGLCDIKHCQGMNRHCVDIHTIENEGDQLLRQAMVNLFKTGDPVNVIKWKEVYEDLETAIDRAEDVANIIEGMVIKYA